MYPPSHPGVESLAARIDALIARLGDRSAALEPVRRAYEAVRVSRHERAAALVALERAIAAAELGFAPA